MNKATHIIDPDGEVVLVLCNANAPFAVWDMPSRAFPESCHDSRSHNADTAQEADDFPNEETAQEADEFPNEETAQEPATAAFNFPSDEKSNCLFIDASNRENGSYSPGVAQQYSDQDSTRENYRIQVSAKHLIFASPMLKKMLTSGMREGIDFLKTGSVEITADSWDLEALLILLRIIHCQHHNVPRQLSLELLAKVAVLSDYYDCQAVLGIFSDIWIPKLKETIPTTYSRNLMLWLWISWFFKLSTQFRQVTSVAMTQTTSYINHLGLPIPNHILGRSA